MARAKRGRQMTLTLTWHQGELHPRGISVDLIEGDGSSRHQALIPWAVMPGYTRACTRHLVMFSGLREPRPKPVPSDEPRLL